MNKKLLMIGIVVCALVIGGCAKQITVLPTAGPLIKVTITLTRPLLAQEAIVVMFSPAKSPTKSVEVSYFAGQTQYWYGDGPNEIQKTKLDAISADRGGISYATVDDYYTYVYKSWTDYVYINNYQAKLVKGPFTTSANTYSEIKPLSNYTPGSTTITFSVNASYLNNGALFGSLYYNITTLASNGTIRDYFESNPSAIVMSSTFTRTESDSTDTIPAPVTGNLVSCTVEIQ
jgi:hypothetical protein